MLSYNPIGGTFLSRSELKLALCAENYESPLRYA